MSLQALHLRAALKNKGTKRGWGESAEETGMRTETLAAAENTRGRHRNHLSVGGGWGEERNVRDFGGEMSIVS